MKKLIFICMLTILISIPMTIFAFGDGYFSTLTFEPENGFSTVITDTNGTAHSFSGVLTASSIEKSDCVSAIGSYEIFYHSETMIKVTLNDIIPKGEVNLSGDTKKLNGFYAVDFKISDSDNTSAFLTGLSDSNLSAVQEWLIGAKLSGADASFDSLDFIDSEKTSPSSNDEQLCWAASTSNILRYTGWAQVASQDFTDEDALLDLFATEFDDNPSNAIYGLEWFFDGSYMAQSYDGWAHVKNYGSSGRYLPQYLYNKDCASIINMSNYDKSKDLENTKNVISSLNDGSGVALSLGWYSGNNRMGGHSISLWGYIYNNNYKSDDTRYYTAFIISDSDSDIIAADRRGAPNVLSAINMSWNDQSERWKFDYYNDGWGEIDGFITLRSYSEDIPTETESNAKMDLINTANLQSSTHISSIKYYLDNQTDFYAGDKIYFYPEIFNNGYVETTGPFTINITVTDLNDNVVFNNTTTKEDTINGLHIATLYDDKLLIPGLEAGKYKVSIKVNPNKTMEESYFYDNIEEKYITVSDKSSPNVTNTSLNAKQVIKSGDSSTIQIDCENLKTVSEIMDNNLKYKIYYSEYYQEYSDWLDWEYCDIGSDITSDDLVKLSNEYHVASPGKYKFMLYIYSENQEILPFSIYSNEVDLQYKSLEVSADETNTGTYTNIPRGTTHLSQGEKFAFTVKNNSFSEDKTDVVYDAEILARDISTGNNVSLYKSEQNILKDGEKSQVTEVSSWQELPGGKYQIIARVSSQDTYYPSYETSLGQVSVQEDISFIVTTGSDTTDEHDGVISLPEAVNNLYTYGSENNSVTFNTTDGIIITKPITLSKDIKIIGSGENISADSKTQLFIIDGEVNVYIANLEIDNFSGDNGGSISNSGSTLSLENCTFSYNTAVVKGGVILNNGGNIVAKNCTFSNNNGGYGGAICNDNSGKINMINCSVLLNKGYGGAIYNNNGSLNVINTTFTSNSNLSGDNGAVTTMGDCNLFNCLTSGNGKIDVSARSGNTAVIGGFITGYSGNVSLNEKSFEGDNLSIYKVSQNGYISPTMGENNKISHMYVVPSPISKNGIYLKNIDGMIGYSADNIEYTKSAIPSVFTDDDYNMDILGNQRNGYFGAVANCDEDYQILYYQDGIINIYSPIEKTATLIVKNSNAEDAAIMNSALTYDISLKVGTNSIDLNDKIGEISEENLEFMLWDGFDTITPLCQKYI